MDAKAIFLLRPGGKALLIMLTAEGRQKEAATPEKARNNISWVLVFDRPQARVNIA
jgi:hypothetical protein